MCEICSKFTRKAPERCCSGVLIVNFEHMLHLFLVSIVGFEQGNVAG